MREYYVEYGLPKSMRVRRACIHCPYGAFKWIVRKTKISYFCEKWNIQLTWSNYSHFNESLINWKECPIKESSNFTLKSETAM